MDIRHLTEKEFDLGVIQDKKQLLLSGTPIVINFNLDTIKEELDTDSKINSDYIEKVKNSPLGSVVVRNEQVLPLNKIQGYKVKAGDELSEVMPIGASFTDIFSNDRVQQYLRDLGIEMFPETNPLTGEQDIDKDAFYTPYVPLTILTKTMTPQEKDGVKYFNPEGTVSIAEFLDSLNAIYYGYSANNHRKKTLDNISTEGDYFNEGYQQCLSGLSSPFFNLYTREELMKPITRLELAYITVLCWSNFVNKFNNIYGGKYYLGINLDWENPYDSITAFKDGFDYKVSCVLKDERYKITSLNIKDYKETSDTMTEYKDKLKRGIQAIPLPMFMSMLELNELDLFYYENKELNPLREVSRGELCYFINNLAKVFK